MLQVVAVAPGEKLLPAAEMNKFAMKCGYLVAPEACTESCMAFLQSQDANFNSTFYSDWHTVENLDELDMRLFQALHYLSTYGTNYTSIPFVPNDEPVKLMFEEFTLIGACTEAELMDKIKGMLCSGVALRGDTLNLLMEPIRDFYQRYGWKVSIDDVANREALVRLCDLYNIVPSDPMGLFRYIVYVTTHQSVIVQNRQLFSILEACAYKAAPVFGRLSFGDMRRLSTLFLRYRRVFLALKRGFNKIIHNLGSRQPWEKNPLSSDEKLLLADAHMAVKAVNKIARLSHKYHKPFVPGVLESITDVSHSPEEIKAAIEACCSPMRLIKLIGYLDDCIAYPPMRAYVIRNGKTFVKRREGDTYFSTLFADRLTILRRLVYYRLLDIMESRSHGSDGKPLTFRLPENLELAAPVSERQMVGGIPFGSSCSVARSSYIGIYWRNEWGTRDFDLWVVDLDGDRVGWDEVHKNDNFLFSGDMTNADPEATEVMYCRGDWPDSTVRVCRYNGEEGSLFRLFLGQDKIKKMSVGYMVDPNTIHLTADLVSEHVEQTVAVVADHKAYIVDLGSGSRQVPFANGIFSLERALGLRFDSALKIRRLLLDSGFVEFKDDDDPESIPDIDLTHPTKDALIALFAEEQKAAE